MRFIPPLLALGLLAMPAISHAETASDLAAAKAKLTAGMPEALRLNYRARIERAFLEAGIDAEVAIRDTGTKREGGRFPRLIIFTYLNKAIVYRLITKDKILDDASAAGFQMVQFMDKGMTEGQWFFDLTKPGDCQRELCWGM